MAMPMLSKPAARPSVAAGDVSGRAASAIERARTLMRGRLGPTGTAPLTSTTGGGAKPLGAPGEAAAAQVGGARLQAAVPPGVRAPMPGPPMAREEMPGPATAVQPPPTGVQAHPLFARLPPALQAAVLAGRQTPESAYDRAMQNRAGFAAAQGGAPATTLMDIFRQYQGFGGAGGKGDGLTLLGGDAQVPGAGPQFGDPRAYGGSYGTMPPPGTASPPWANWPAMQGSWNPGPL